MSERIFVVVNPRAGKGRAQRVAGAVLDTLRAGARVEHAYTTRPGDEATLAEAALKDGFRTLVALGGDGTWSHVGDAIVRSGEPARLGLVPGGTGCDFAKSLGLPVADPRACARVVLAGRERRVDVGRIGRRHFLNVAGFGYDVAVLEDSWRVSWLAGAPLYVFCALRQLGSYAGLRIEIEADDAPPRAAHLMMLVLANARFFGGAFHIAPRADLEDGRLDALAFSDVSLPRRLQLMARLMRGTHVGDPAVTHVGASRFALRFAEPPAFETDGEWNRAETREVRVETLPRALRVLVP